MSINSINPVLSQNIASMNNISQNTNTNSNTFQNILNNTINTLNNNINTTQESIENIMTGKSDDFHKFLVESEKTSINIQLTLQVRNKVVEAYNDIMRMQV
jgi:flagellar hook-basal body complex protein FliE